MGKLKRITCSSIKNITKNNYFFSQLKKYLPRKHVFKMQANDLIKKTEQFFDGKLIVFISDEESFNNIRVLVNLKFVDKIFVYANDESKIDKILLNSPKYYGFSNDFREIKKKIYELSAENLKSKIINIL